MTGSIPSLLRLLLVAAIIATGVVPSSAAGVSHETVACGLWEAVAGDDWMICAGRTTADDTAGPDTWAFAARADCIRHADDDWSCDLNLFHDAHGLLPTAVQFMGHDRVVIDALLSGGCQLSVEFVATSTEYRSNLDDLSVEPEVDTGIWRPAIGEGSACGRSLPATKATAGYIGELANAG